jgi:hypothetical protein
MCSLSSTTSTCETMPDRHAPQLTRVIGGLRGPSFARHLRAVVGPSLVGRPRARCRQGL